MTIETKNAVEFWIKPAQLGVAVLAIAGAFVYAGQRSERDEQQTRAWCSQRRSHAWDRSILHRG
jgi:hypothetical protein